MVFAPRSPPSSVDQRGWLADCALLVAGGGALLIAVVLWFDNAQGGLTGNGVFKSIELKPWIVDPAGAPLYPSNYLFYPVYGLLCRLLDLVGVFAGDPRRQLTILNSLSASLCLCLVYGLVRRLTGERPIALIAAGFHLASMFVLFLAITNEDIMPSYTVMFAAMALAALWFAEPSVPRVLSVAVLFSLGWLFEWRLMFPTLPAMLLALWLCEPHFRRRLAWIALFCAGLMATAAVMALVWAGHRGAVGPFDLIWTGKAVHSVWAGFTWAKLGYMRDGIAAYWLGTGITTFRHIPGWDLWRYLSLAAELAIAVTALRALWPYREDGRARALVAVFGGTFAAGEVFNLYSQPQDPQMQINVMAWLTVGWAIVLLAARRRWGRQGLAAFAGLTVALFAYNVWSLEPERGLDTRWKHALDRIEQHADPARTVFLLHDFDWAMIYASLHWGVNEPGTDALGPAPQATPKFKWIGFAGQVMRHPDWTVEHHVDDLRHEIDRALELGYDVIVLRLWDLRQPDLETATGMIVDRQRLAALREMLHRDYTAVPVYDDPIAGPVVKLQKAPGR
ncbi:MAG TPA: hypothetical protein VMI56_04660 [Reyranella sp.]|nr:hypothetical protein [Reyranella sp.]